MLLHTSKTLCNAAKGVHATVRSMIGTRRLFVATWIEGKNWGDDYLSQCLIRYLRLQGVDYEIIETNLHLDHHRLTKRDVLLIGGGGLWGPSGTGRLAQKLYSAWITTKASLIVANIGIESFDPSSAPQLIDLAAKSKLLSFRDQKSYTIACRILGEGKCMWGADNTYLASLQIERSPVSRCIAVNLCGPEQENNIRKYSVEALIDNIVRLKLLNFSLKGAVFTYGGPLSDYPYCAQVDPTCDQNFSSIPFQNCELFIGMHFHSCVLALQNEIPTIGISYSDKVQRLFCEYGLIAYCIEPEDAGAPGKIQSIVESIYDDRERVVSKIRDSNARARKRLAPFTTRLKQILDSE